MNEVNWEPMSWDEYFMRHVYLAARKSKDPSSKIGSVIVKDNSIISEGYNGMPVGVSDLVKERYIRPNKYYYFEHAERNSIFHCSRHGIPTKNSILYTQGLPCSDCARAIIQSGIKTIVLHKQYENVGLMSNREKWIESGKVSKEMLSEANVEIKIFDKELGVLALISEKEYKL